MGYPHRGSKKIFWNSGLAPIDFSCPKTPEYQKSANFEKKIFLTRYGRDFPAPFKGGGNLCSSTFEKKKFFFNFCKNDPTTPNFMRKIDCAHRKILKKFFGGQKIEKNASKLGVISFNPNKIIFRGNFVRG